MNTYPHNWTHTLRLDKEPWNNKLVRKAANYAIDRVGICKSLLNDTCAPASGITYKGHPWFGNPKEKYEYNPAKAKELLRQAGFDGVSKRPAKAVHLISTSGSGQMLPLPMNELVQKNLKEVGIDIDLQPVEWNALTQRFRVGFTGENAGMNAWNRIWPMPLCMLVNSQVMPPMWVNGKASALRSVAVTASRSPMPLATA